MRQDTREAYIVGGLPDTWRSSSLVVIARQVGLLQGACLSPNRRSPTVILLARHVAGDEARGPIESASALLKI